MIKIIILVIIIAVIGAVSIYLLIPADIPVYATMNCDQMLDFSSTDVHGLLSDSEHLLFHTHYIENCSNELP